VTAACSGEKKESPNLEALVEAYYSLDTGMVTKLR